MKKHKILLTLSILFVIAGIALLVYPILPLPGRFYTTGVISRISEEGEVFIRYEEAGLIREKQVNVKSKRLREGTELKLYYTRNNHDDLKNGAPIKEGYYLIIVGLFLIPITWIVKKVSLHKKQIREDLTRSGEKIFANLKEVRMLEKTDSNGNHPYFIVCSWTDPTTNQEYLFRSREIWFNPTEIINIHNISSFTVYVDKKNRERYFVDINILNRQT